jgi:DNA-binding MarR family transcriptional regulator
MKSRLPAAPSRAVTHHGKMLEVLELFRIVFKSIREHYRSVERRTGISGAQLWALAQVAENPGISAGDLGRALAVHQSTASNLLRALEASSLLVRQRVHEDKRSVRLFATPKGMTVIRRAPQPLIGVLQQALSDLPNSNLDALHRQLAGLIGRLQTRHVKARGMPLSDL